MNDRWQPLYEAARALCTAQMKEPPHALFGFDGYIDSLYAVADRTDEAGQQTFFETSDAFLQCLSDLKGQSAERMLHLKSRQAGGNAPLTAMAAAALGVDAHCVGFIGENHPQFEVLRKRCRTTSLGEPAECMALEFANCKWMLSSCESLNSFHAEDLLKRFGDEGFSKAIEDARIIALLNWAAMPQNSDVVRLLLEGYQESEHLSEKTFFVDFSDISGLSDKTIQGYMDTLRLLSRHAHVVVSVNLHEAQTIARSCGKENEEEAVLLSLIHDAAGAQEVVLHAMDHAFCLCGGVLSSCRGVYLSSPVITTGGGDHFNGGYCAAILAGLPTQQRLELATATALFYVSHGYSGTAQQIKNWLAAQRKDQMEG